MGWVHLQAVIDRRGVFRYLVLPALAGLAATVLVYGLIQRGAARPGPAPVPVVVARRVIPARTVLKPAMLTVKAFPTGLFGPAAVHGLKGAVGRTTTQSLAQGEVLYSDALARPGDRSALSYHIPAGLRAVTLSVNEQVAVADLLQPGDHVDVVAAKTGARGSPAGAALILQDRLVLALGQNQDAGTRPPSPGSVHSVTLALTPAQAVQLVAAQQRGAVRLLLDPAAAGGS